jgi:iron only hydrogenase large subunit-like protein
MCGTCFLVCPQACKVIRDDLPLARRLIAEDKEVIASVAPSFLASFPGVSFVTLRAALLKLGFADAEETAVGATIVKKQYDALCDDGKHDIVISTCCHSINLLIEKHYPDAAVYLAPVLSPMLAHGLDLKKRHPEAKVIFLGPCISKKNEIEMYPGAVDCVLTFLELGRWLEAAQVAVAKDSDPKKVEASLARLFPIEGGILATMAKDNPAFTYLAITGMEASIAALKDILSGKVHHAFIEMSSCVGSCINGPALDPKARSAVSSYLAVQRSAGARDFVVASYASEELAKRLPAFKKEETIPSEEEITAVLRKIGKTSRKDELNCSSCGYPTCRDKAVAVLRGKASLEMCLPFLMQKAQSFSNSIVDTSDNAILALNEELVVQLANPAMGRLLGKDPKDLVGKSAAAFLEPDLFALALAGTPVRGRKLFWKVYGKYVDATVSYDPQFHIIIGVYRDVTSETLKRQKDQEIAAAAAAITTEVIDKNMRAVQEIASLLGESTAETKVALSRLKDVLAKEGKEDGK